MEIKQNASGLNKALSKSRSVVGKCKQCAFCRIMHCFRRGNFLPKYIFFKWANHGRIKNMIYGWENTMTYRLGKCFGLEVSKEDNRGSFLGDERSLDYWVLEEGASQSSVSSCLLLWQNSPSLLNNLCIYIYIYVCVCVRVCVCVCVCVFSCVYSHVFYVYLGKLRFTISVIYLESIKADCKSELMQQKSNISEQSVNKLNKLD